VRPSISTNSAKQTGFIQVPLSVHDDAWGVIPIPIAVISNGRGPTVILEGGNHGDEYEGPIALGELIRTLDPGAVSGRLIFIPAINLPAVVAARRTSPLDDLNFNRAFPGNPLGSPTQQIAAYVRDDRRKQCPRSPPASDKAPASGGPSCALQVRVRMRATALGP
jgi:N2-acetyl-L-2,4-diaminobutanoate deacetylase